MEGRCTVLPFFKDLLFLLIVANYEDKNDLGC